MVEDASLFCHYLVQFLEENQEELLPASDVAAFLKQAVSANSMQMPNAGPLQSVGDMGGQFVFKLDE
ncbi:hypothetical protein GF354_05665 [Candidatus Peregrinibacteria bacterium]|nr:hypothetical protein [Candidatus Peregrinibacteria bacterium]